MPQISVIVPAYNVEAYLYRCVDSILAQTFTDFDLILVDDGSPDNSGTICDEYAARDERVHVIHQKNGGLSAARNAGIDWAFSNSDSHWLSFIDSDDWVHPGFLEALINSNIENETKICACNYARVESKDNDYPDFAIPESTVVDPEYIYTNGGKNIYAYAWNKLYSKELWENNRYPEGKNWEDTATTYKLLFSVPSISFVDAELYYYFQNEDGIVKQEWTPKKLDHFWALEQVMQDPMIKEHPQVVKLLWNQYIYTAYEQIGQIDESTKLNQKDKDVYRQDLAKKLRKALIIKAKTAGISIVTHKWYYSTAFPKLDYLYWTGVGILGKLKRAVGR